MFEEYLLLASQVYVLFAVILKFFNMMQCNGLGG